MAPRWAREVGRICNLSIFDKKAAVGWFSVAGALDGFPVAVIWATRPQHNQLMPFRHVIQFIVRFRELPIERQELLRMKIASSPEILEALNSSRLSNEQWKHLGLAETLVDFHWGYSLPRPSAEKIAKVLRSILAAVKEVAEPVHNRCQACEATQNGELYYVDKIPVSICGNCRERLGMEDRRAEEGEVRREIRPIFALIVGALVAGIFGIGWGWLTFSAKQMMPMIALLIGAPIGWTVHRSMGKITLWGHVLAVTLTGASVAFGNTLFVALSVMEKVHLTLSPQVFFANFQTFFRLMLAEPFGNISIIFAMIVAFAMAWFHRKPELKRRLVPILRP